MNGSYIYMKEKLLTLEPSGKSQDACWSFRLKKLSATEIFRLTSINNPTAISATSSEKVFPASVTWIPRRLHSARSMWLIPAVEAQTRRREGRRSRTSALTGKRVVHRMAWMEEAWWGLVAMNWWRGGREEGFRMWKFWEGFGWRNMENLGGPWMNIFGRLFWDCWMLLLVVLVLTFWFAAIGYCHSLVRLGWRVAESFNWKQGRRR